MTKRIGRLVLALAAATPVPASAPDCSGISGVFNVDPDFIDELTTHRVVEGLEFPVFVAMPPGDTERLFIVEQAGRIRIAKNGGLLATPFLDIDPDVQCCGEEGLLGLAFHPDYSANGWFFVYHTNNAGDAVVARFSVSNEPDIADPGSRVDVLTIPHPVFGNHNGGMIAFSPLDGHLYIGTGDGGGGCDPGPGTGNAQSLDSNLGKLLRLGVDSLPASTAGNPYDGAVPGNDEIWARGLRNPWRWSFDRLTGALYLGDVGEGLWEEIDCSPASSAGGENYGWSFYEGSHCPNPSCGPQGSCALADHVPPIREYDHGIGCVAVGGYVYRGCRMRGLHGSYFYADACTEVINSFRTDGSCSAAPDILRRLDLEPEGTTSINAMVGFGEDPRGEIYVVDYTGGEVFKLLPELSIMEVSGPGAPPLVLQPSGALAWEALESPSSFVPYYKVYRSTSGPTGPFSCVAFRFGPAWVEGDPQIPDPGSIFHYLVTGLTATLIESTAGARSDGTLRTVDNASGCLH